MKTLLSEFVAVVLLLLCSSHYSFHHCGSFHWKSALLAKNSLDQELQDWMKKGSHRKLYQYAEDCILNASELRLKDYTSALTCLRSLGKHDLCVDLSQKLLKCQDNLLSLLGERDCSSLEILFRNSLNHREETIAENLFQLMERLSNVSKSPGCLKCYWQMKDQYVLYYANISHWSTVFEKLNTSTRVVISPKGACQLIRCLHQQQQPQQLRLSASISSPIDIHASHLPSFSTLLSYLHRDNLLATPEVSQYLSSLLSSNISYLTSCVNWTSLPSASHGPEFAFYGKSNVGKSSLLNMLCHRKNLAYTSKTPGKTIHYNYFQSRLRLSSSSSRLPSASSTTSTSLATPIATASSSGSSLASLYYFVDMPGSGYAKVAKDTRDEWRDFMYDYVAHRSNLKILFHLFDSRHELDPSFVRLPDEAQEWYRCCPSTLQYVVVFTKLDQATALRSLYDQILKGQRPSSGYFVNTSIPYILTSSVDHWGGGDLWKVIVTQLELWQRKFTTNDRSM